MFTVISYSINLKANALNNNLIGITSFCGLQTLKSNHYKITCYKCNEKRTNVPIAIYQKSICI